MSSYSSLIFGGGDRHRITTGASKSIPAQVRLWTSWLIAGLTCLYLGNRAVMRGRNFLWAIVIALILYEIGLDAARRKAHGRTVFPNRAVSAVRAGQPLTCAVLSSQC